MSFDSYHPLIQLLYFCTVFICTSQFNHPIFLVISFIISCLYCIKCTKPKFLFYFLIFLFIIIHTAWYAMYHHYGITKIGENWIGNAITLESIVFGFVQAVTIISIFNWILCMHRILTSDKIIYLTGRVLPKGSLFLSILFRTIPCISQKGREICQAQNSIGKGIRQGHIWERVIHTFRFLAILITWLIDNYIETAMSMKSRGYGGRKRTSFALYHIHNRDRVTIFFMSVCITLLISGNMLEQMHISYNPEILVGHMGVQQMLFAIIYVVFCALPFLLENRNDIYGKDSLFIDKSTK